MIRDDSKKIKDALSIETLLEKLGDKDKKMNTIIRLYAYKTIFNQNGKQMDVFLDKAKKRKFKFDKYKGFKAFFKLEEEEIINYGFETLDNDYDVFFSKIEKNKKNSYDKKIEKSDIVGEEESFIDNFINASINLILSKLKKKDFELSDEYENFFNNICKPLFEGDEKLFKIIEFLFNPKKYEELQKYGINSSNIDAILFGLRYSLNCISEIPENDDEDKIPSKLIIQLLKPESVQSFSLLISGKKSDEQIVCIDQLKISLLAKGCLCKGIISLISNLITEKKPEYGHR